jgi:hypothetical protein
MRHHLVTFSEEGCEKSIEKQFKPTVAQNIWNLRAEVKIQIHERGVKTKSIIRYYILKLSKVRKREFWMQ